MFWDEIIGTSDYLWVYKGNFFKIKEIENKGKFQ